MSCTTPSKKYHINKKPSANAERFISIPKNKQNEKKATSLRKKANKNSRSENMIDISVKSENEKPKIRLSTATNKVEIAEKTTTVKNLESINSFLLKPSMRFCLSVLLLYSFAVIDTITTAKKNLSIAATYVLKCQMYGKLKIPWSARRNSAPKRLNLIEASSAIADSNTKYPMIRTRDVLLCLSL